MIGLAHFAKMSRRERGVLLGCVVAVILAILDRAALAPIIDKMRQFNTQIKTTKEEMYRDARIISQRSRIEAEEKKSALVGRPVLSDEATTAALLRTIESLASAAGVQITDLKPGGTQQDAAVKKFIVTLSCEAEMEQLVSFFHGLESSESMIEIASFSLTPRSRQSTTIRCELALHNITLR